ncbi:MAG TPA: hypothetical protein VHP35_11445, partial [Terriglobia bacterium]|nr:hypothetical protein [Terriglobia bacterium]
KTSHCATASGFVISLASATRPPRTNFATSWMGSTGCSRVDSQDARVRFVGFGSSSLDVEILAYILTTDFTVFLGIQE